MGGRSGDVTGPPKHFAGEGGCAPAIAAARLPFGGISEKAVNASLALIESAKPRDEIECTLVIQMACTHTAAMAVLGRLGSAHGPDRSVSATASAAGRLLRAGVIHADVLGEFDRVHAEVGEKRRAQLLEWLDPHMEAVSGLLQECALPVAVAQRATLPSSVQ